MFSCGLFSLALWLDQRPERKDKYCTTATLERQLEVFEWVCGDKAIVGGVPASIVDQFIDPTNPHTHHRHRYYYKHEATLPDFATKPLSQYKLTPARQCDFELVQAVTDYLGRKQRWASDGWKFKYEISSGREQLLLQRDPDATPQKVVLLEREVPCVCGRGSNCFRNENMPVEDAKEKAHMLRQPPDNVRRPGYVLRWADPPSREEEGNGVEGSTR